MNPFQFLFRSRDKPKRSAQDYLPGAQPFFYGGSTAGKYVNERTAMQTTAVYSCIRILSESVVQLPFQVFR